MAGPQPKQFLALDGVPILIHSLRAFAAAPRVTAIYVAVRKPEMERVEAQVAEYGFAGRVHVVEGGEKRQESVANALSALPAEPDDIVLVHDAVRPLIDAATIERTIDAVAEYRRGHRGHARRGHHQAGGADRARRADYRHHSARVCGAGADAAGLPLRAARSAPLPRPTADGFVGTDEASLVERAGIPVAVVHGSQVNLKITQPGDLELAEFYLRQRSTAASGIRVTQRTRCT